MVTDRTADNAGSLDLFDKGVAICSAILGVVPPSLTGFGYHWASLYNPPIYEHLEFFLIIPVSVALYTSWSVLIDRSSMRPVFWTFLVLSIITLLVYLVFPEPHVIMSKIDIHSLNWILSYCVVAMAIALLAGFLIALKKS